MSEGESTEHLTSLRARCLDPGFTPGVRDVAALLELCRECADNEKLGVTALGRGDHGVARKLCEVATEAATEAVTEAVTEADAAQRVVVVRSLARICARIEVEGFVDVLARALKDPEPRVVREAARALGKLPGVDGAIFEQTLISVCTHAQLPERRAAVDALGKLGGARALQALCALDVDDRDLRRRMSKAITLLERRARRTDSCAVVENRALSRAHSVLLRCREGTATWVAQQAQAYVGSAADDIHVRDPHTVQLGWSGTLGELWSVRMAMDVALAFPLPAGAELSARIVEGLTNPHLVAALTSWTDGPPRFRLAFVQRGAGRAVVWRVAAALREVSSPLHNDSREVSWTIEADESKGQLLCVPKDPGTRFPYRKADIPAASHPTLAALLAWTGKPVAGDVVWDPFCGSGSELIECTLLEPDITIFGNDISQHALTAARTNFEHAGLGYQHVGLRQADALTHAPRAPSLVLTNPPMGRRVNAEGGVHELLCGFVAHIATVLCAGGRLVWVSPAGKVTAAEGARQGLAVQDYGIVDMGGLRATLQVMRKVRESS